MPYATLTELLERIPEGVLIDLTDDDAAGVVDKRPPMRAAAAHLLRRPALGPCAKKGRHCMPVKPPGRQRK